MLDWFAAMNLELDGDVRDFCLGESESTTVHCTTGNSVVRAVLLLCVSAFVVGDNDKILFLKTKPFFRKPFLKTKSFLRSMHVRCA